MHSSLCLSGGLGTGMLSLPWAMAGASIVVGSAIIVSLGCDASCLPDRLSSFFNHFSMIFHGSFFSAGWWLQCASAKRHHVFPRSLGIYGPS